jgi:hypothetical protein
MNKIILSLLGCSGSIAGVLATGTIASPDTAKTIPYPEVMNLDRVPLFDTHGIIPPTAIAKGNLPHRSARKVTIAQLKPKPIAADELAKVDPAVITADLTSQTVRKIPQPLTIPADLIDRTVREISMTKHTGDRLGDRNFAPTSMMVLGYSSPGGSVSMYPRTMMY